MSNTIPINMQKIITNNDGKIIYKEEKIKLMDNTLKNNDNTILSTTMSMSMASLELNKNQRKDKYGVLIQKNMKKHKISFNTEIETIDVDNYKEFNKGSSFIFFETLSDLPMNCSSCIIY
jgi:hypothetical protein